MCRAAQFLFTPESCVLNTWLPHAPRYLALLRSDAQRSKHQVQSYSCLVHAVGLEPTKVHFEHLIYSQARLPLRHACARKRALCFDLVSIRSIYKRTKYKDQSTKI
jgi:hypothetical protein